jgi:pimeloyl-ACP methyl ester carboxylesterase
MLATLGRIAAATEQSPAFSGHVPEGGLLKALARVLTRLESAPTKVTLTQGTDERTVVVNADLVRFMARRNAGRRTEPNAWPEMILAMDRGDFSLVARNALSLRDVSIASPMHHSMDCASGISEWRRQQYRDASARVVLGDINLEYEAICDVWPHDDLGASFRTNVVSDIPTVIVQGTWDMSTPLDNAREVVASLRNGQLVEVVGGNHGALYNLYARWPPIYPLLREFLSGRNVRFPSTVDDMSVFSSRLRPYRGQ